MRQFLAILVILMQAKYAYGQELKPANVSVDFQVNGTSLKISVPSEFVAITDPDALSDFPYPENQNLYCIMKPTSGHESRYIAIGSRPELDAQEISSELFTDMGKSFAQEMDSRTIQDRIDSFESLIDEWRANKGQPGFEAVKTLEAKAVDDALIMTGVVLNEDGSELINSVRLQHVKNRVVVMAVSSILLTDADISWVVSTANSLKGAIR